MEKLDCEFCGLSTNNLPEWKAHHLAMHRNYSPWVPLHETLGKTFDSKLNTPLSKPLS